jgi:hypothetical protein
MEPIAIENRPNFYKRPTLIVREPRESIAAKDYSIVEEEPGTNGGIYLQYKFEENGNEEKNGSYNLTPNGSPNFSNYVELDGDDYLSVGINFEVKTLSFWFNLNNANTDNYLLSFDSNFNIKVNSNSLDFQTDNENNCNISKDFYNNMWYNLALTSNNENYDIYLNNTKLPETIIYKDLSSSTLNIGAYITDELQIEKYTTSITIESHSMVVINNNMYVFGGTTSNKFYKINTDGTIEEKTLNGNTDNIPSTRSKHSMVAIGSNIYIFGGKNDGIDFDDFYKIDTTTYNSTKIELQPTDGNSDNKPSARSGHSMVAINSNIYIYGGYDNFQGIFFDDFYKIDTTSSNCTKIELQPTDGTKPTERSGHSMVAIESNIYIFGGHYANFFDDFYKIDTTTNISTEIELQPIDGNSDNRPSKRTGHSMVAIGTNIYIFGGMYADGNSELYNDLYKIDINGNSKKISFNAESITERYFHTMVVLDNNFYIYGGKNIDGNTVILNDLVKIPTDIKYLNGKIADLRLYNTIKTEDEINTIYNEYNYVNIYTHILEEDIEYDFSSVATFQGWINKANSHNIQCFNFKQGRATDFNVLSGTNDVPNNFMYIECDSTIYKDFSGLLLELPTTHNYVEFTSTSRSSLNNEYIMFIDTIEKLDQDIFISNEDKNYRFEDNIEKFNEEYYYFAQFSSASSSVTKKYNYKPGHYLKIINSYTGTRFNPNIKITLKKNYTEYTNLTFNENALFDILVVGGGGAGGRNKNTNNRGGGGGGAGGLIHLQNYNISSGNYVIKVGNGGKKTSSIGNNGQNSSFYNLIAMGGGGGGSGNNEVVPDCNGRSGGSGGGGGDTGGIGGTSIINQGFNGGNAKTDTESVGGGGGGGGGSYSAGSNYSNDNEGGLGGSGTDISITGTNILYAKGGNGGPWYSDINIEDATPNTGNGGHGNKAKDAGNGGSGIVILKKIRTDPPTSDGILTLNIINDLDSGYILDSSISSNYANITKIILNVNANIYRNDKLENYGQAGLIIDLNSLTKLTELELNINPSKGIYGGPGSPGTSGNPGGDPIKIIGNGSISIRYTEGAKLFKGGNGGNYTDWNDEVTIELGYGLYSVNNTYYPKPQISIPNTDGLIGEFFNGNKKVKYNYNIIFEETHTIESTYSVIERNAYEVADANTARNIFNDDNVYRYHYDSTSKTIDIHFVNKPAEGTNMTPFVMDTLSTTPIVFNNNHPIIYDFSHITSLPDWNTYATDYGFNSTFDAGFQEANYLYYTGVWTHDEATGFISKEIPARYNKLRVEYQALWEDSTPDIADTVSIYITSDSITNYITLDPTLDTNDITEPARDTATVADGLKIFEATINPETDKYLTIAERYSTLSNNLKIVFY